ncbi:MAG: hypothetical protein MOB07_31075 [Acidobacteria bacterium]|nr:hypothetical protein [Acidobacteriota bacterium]
MNEQTPANIAAAVELLHELDARADRLKDEFVAACQAVEQQQRFIAYLGAQHREQTEEPKKRKPKSRFEVVQFRHAEGFQVVYKGRLCTPTFESRGGALAYINILDAGVRKPEYVEEQNETILNERRRKLGPRS